MKNSLINLYIISVLTVPLAMLYVKLKIYINKDRTKEAFDKLKKTQKHSFKDTVFAIVCLIALIPIVNIILAILFICIIDKVFNKG
jgi:uncharacterized membrane protein